jgi:O-acetylhomoserine (thiol)-lyase
MDADALKAAGISEGLIRISVGIENIDDLVEDIGRALKASQHV